MGRCSKNYVSFSFTYYEGEDEIEHEVRGRGYVWSYSGSRWEPPESESEVTELECDTLDVENNEEVWEKAKEYFYENGGDLVEDEKDYQADLAYDRWKDSQI